MNLQTIEKHKLDWADIAKEIQEDDKNKVDVQTDNIWMDYNGELIIDGETGYKIEDFNRIISGGNNYLNKCPDHLRAENVNHWISENKKTNKSYFIRTKGDKVRAILSEKYSKLDNFPIFCETWDHFRDDCVPVDFRLTDEGFDMRLANKQGVDVSLVNEGDIVHGGVHVRNSEVGRSSVKILVMSYRLVCKNGMISPKSSAVSSYRHFGHRDLSEFFRQGIVQARMEFMGLLDSIKESHNDRFEPLKVHGIIEHLSQRFQWTKKYTEVVEEKFMFEPSSKFGLIQVITSTTKNFPDQLEHEKHAGLLLQEKIGG